MTTGPAVGPVVLDETHQWINRETYAGAHVDIDVWPVDGRADRWAVWSRDAARQYRYVLGRRWSPAPPAVWVMLNPSTADARVDDPTISRVTRRSRAAGAGGVIVLNLFGYRSTEPARLHQLADPVGPWNDEIIAAVLAAAPDRRVYVAWGAHYLARRRGDRVLAMIARAGRTPMCLGATQSGYPRHPLYVRGDIEPIPW